MADGIDNYVNILGESLIVTKIDHLARDLRPFLALVEDLEDDGDAEPEETDGCVYYVDREGRTWFAR